MSETPTLTNRLCLRITHCVGNIRKTAGPSAVGTKADGWITGIIRSDVVYILFLIHVDSNTDSSGKVALQIRMNPPPSMP